MDQSHRTRQAGFTIIEVVLVLAIAALIMLMVFIALPALQRSQRDTARKNDISRLIAQTTNYKTNNKGRVPFAADGRGVNLGAGQFIDDYLKLKQGGEEASSFADPRGPDYQFVKTLDGEAGSGQILVTPGGGCDGEKTSNPSSLNYASRGGTFRIKLESGGQHCAEY